MIRRFASAATMLVALLIPLDTSRAECVDVLTSFKITGHDPRKCPKWKADGFCYALRVKERCPVSCNLCPCADTEGTFPVNKKSKTCKDVSKNGKICKKQEFIDNCPVSCKLCPTMVPSSTPSTTPTLCEDTKGKFDGNKKCMNAVNNPQLCRRKIYIENCPKSCDLCIDVTPTSLPTTTPTLCEDTEGKFDENKKCGKAVNNPQLCRGKIYMKNCPKSCDLCIDVTPTSLPTATPTLCEDTKGKFDGNKNCRKAVNNPQLCRGKIYMKNCPKSCDLCIDVTPTSLPTTSPTETPSGSPTTPAPTKVPTLSPTAVPTRSPTGVPTPSPTWMTCDLKGTLSFPSIDEAPFFGYHEDKLEVSKAGNDKVCERTENTNWGCVHKGVAKIINWENYYGSESTSESATIEYAAGSSYRFKVEHVFDSDETYYKDDYMMRGELTVVVNDKILISYSHPSGKNPQVDTHNSDGSVNPAYEGIGYIDVECNDKCVCEVKTSEPKCTVKAEMKFPAVKDAEFGYHNDFISATKKGSEGSCSELSRETTWCTHTGDAAIYNKEDPDDDYNYDYSESEAIFIEEAANAGFVVKVNHWFNEDEKKHEDDYLMAGELTLWVNGKEKGQYKHEIIEGVDTHLENGDINPNYDSEYYLNVECTKKCECTIVRLKNTQCKIGATVAFPEKKNAVFGHHSDNLTVEKLGEADMCEREHKGEIGWGCTHDGKNANISKLDQEDGDVFSKESESVLIKNGKDGNFRFSLTHSFDENEDNEKYKKDYKMVGVMTLLINNQKKGSFNHPHPNGVDTHLKNGAVNPEYQGQRYVDVKCDSDCNCDIQQHAPTCEIKAEISFPNKFPGNSYGYHNDMMKVSKDGVTGDDCNYQNVMTSWGCIHRGDAYIESTEWYYYDDTESVNIPDAANGKFIFTVEHYNSYYENDYEGDHQNVGVATITVNGNAFTTFKHPKNKNQEPTNEDGTVNEDFKGTAELVVECSEDCECFIVN